MTKPDSRDTEGIDVAREIRRAATEQVAAAIEAELLGADSHAIRRDQTEEPSSTPSGDGPDAQPSGSPDWDAIKAARAGNASHAIPERETQDIAGIEDVWMPEQPRNASHEHRKAQDNHAANVKAVADYMAYAEGTPETGNVPPMPAGDPAAIESPCAREDLGEAVRRRFITEGRWREVSLVRDRMMVEAKKAIPDKEARRAWVYAELDKMYPPVQVETRTSAVGTKGLTETFPICSGISESDSGSIQGLNEVPKDWPELPANASLAGEIGWVQANRLRIVEERPGKATVVKLVWALSPAPSWAALGWLETSIRSYAKFVDVAAKVSGGEDDEGAVMKRERRSVDEVKALLASMEEATGACPHCGRSG